MTKSVRVEFGIERVENRGRAALRGALFVALRPIQVLPAWQSLNLSPGFAPIFRVELDGGLVRVNVEKRVVLVTPPDGFGAAGAGDAPLTDALRAGRLPPRPAARASRSSSARRSSRGSGPRTATRRRRSRPRPTCARRSRASPRPWRCSAA
jgi:hypothetical protein